MSCTLVDSMLNDCRLGVPVQEETVTGTIATMAATDHERGG